MNKIFFDIETKNTFSDVGSNDPSALSLSVVCTYDSATDLYQSFLEDELQNLWPIFEKADLLIGFNIDHFDIPILNKYYSGDLKKIKTLDLLKEVKNILGRRIKLDTLTEATLGQNKSGDGLDAIRWWRKGEIQKVRDYCIDDVRITRELYEYAKKNGHVKYLDGKTLKVIKLNTANWEKQADSATAQTLPF